MNISVCSIHPQGWVPIETLRIAHASRSINNSSIHPQGWVPIETHPSLYTALRSESSIHPQGWVPIETFFFKDALIVSNTVAFTPKGGCPLKQSV